ncbi:AMP-dependent synthetase/ligase [Phycicoccus sp. SLBN-51]|uniref:AMP-dependent synthetase/ligase n=1 Tax=Phycicoccus sp. SLBN-51 TaxID=2768447 RepID=UPI001153CCF8|nr:AMP-dependent synthetase/ligase [Phycicoccus sp. SLBN-51]TQJ50393.1 long-chain acyl-CoA synthetase [Phycicoccus sp. SLBN-51]
MQDHVVPPLVEPTTEGSLADLPARNAARNPHRVAFSKKAEGRWVDVTAAQFHNEVRAVAKGLVAAGVRTGDRVGIMCKTRYEWTVVDFAAWTAGAVPVPIYETSSAEQVLWILKDSGAKGIVVETPAHEAIVAEVRDDLPELEHVWQVDAGGIDALAQAGAAVDDAALEAAREGVDRTSVATIIYTSGTTGRPKGCQLTHDNFMALSENAVRRLEQVVQRQGASTLLFLPLAHVFARFIEVLCVDGEARMGHSADIKNLLTDFADFRPTFILSVPRVFEKIYNSAEQKATAEGKGKIFATAADTAIAWSTALDNGGAGLGLRLRHAVFDRLVYGKLRAAMGGQVLYAVSGGAPLGTRLGHFFRGIGVTVLEGYGLTETTAPATVNIPERVKIGTVGPPLPGVGIRIADDGEVLIRGNNVFASYHNNDEATSAALQDGWFHTGDIGELDEDGYLRITGRKKELLVTAGGKNVAPAVLEDRLRAHPLVSQCIVVGDQKPFIAALVTLDPEMYPAWAKNNGIEGVTLEQARTNDVVRAEIQRAVDDANKAVSKAESIRKFAILEGDFTEENGYLTPSMKLKRNIVLKDFHDDVEAIYA